jgi:putative N6-adenine-specific DNA methylase
MEQYFAQCPLGLASMLVQELSALGASECIATDAGVAFKGDMLLGYRANLHSRIASRILWQQAIFPYQNEHDIYDAVHLLPWTSHFDVSRTISLPCG